ncbi:ribose-phosphate pyrophosphokinase [Paraburkholderia sp. Ac-20336]|uniref:ribose-phosphate pyrophosphokinase-like domain-containing protein n=1 Tax=Paraburkholderia sp. Ac-20336 TaxID=2703886 RepID=UPI00198263FA|nr:ribose-phosphate pyrophosphokinase-like domain-containing protein [Paraburkholderia sp. Ac-20336]MBN3806780.1 ribose-phosphate pyrophosphokinase [Paraburkholderia sp. Ac-20336]
MLNITAVTTMQHDAESSLKARNPVGLKVLKFPGGEMHVTVQTGVPAGQLELNAHLPDAAAVMTLLMTTDALRRAYPDTPLDLHLPYVPYARQDRVANPGESLSAKVFCDLINAQHYRRVVIQDPHSDVTAALLDRVVIDDPLPALRRVVEQVLRSRSSLALVAPDAGARKRVLKLASQLNSQLDPQLDLPVVFADKVRDTRTGAITGTAIQGDLPECALLVIDDICDGGRTFTELAQALDAKQARGAARNPLYLYVTHGIFSKGLDALLEHYAAVFTRNNWTDDARAVLA